MTCHLPPLLAEALDAHGGTDRWRNHRGMASTIRTSGELWALKGVPILAEPRRAASDFHRQWTKVTPFGEAGWELHWEPDHLEIRSSDGSVMASRDRGREEFDRSDGGQWDPLNLAYFNGYAMWTYHAVPFAFANSGYVAREIESIADRGQLLHGVEVRFPDQVHSHSREQQFYFGSDGLLRRHDYRVEVWDDKPAAHYLSDYVDVGGLKYPTRRRVYLRNADGTPQPDLTLVSIDLEDYALY